MHLKKTPIATHIESCQDCFFHGFHGYRDPPRDVGGLPAAIEPLLESPEDCKQFGESAHLFAEKWLSQSAAAKRLQEVFYAWQHRRPWPTDPDDWADQITQLQLPN